MEKYLKYSLKKSAALSCCIQAIAPTKLSDKVYNLLLSKAKDEFYDSQTNSLKDLDKYELKFDSSDLESWLDLPELSSEQVSKLIENLLSLGFYLEYPVLTGFSGFSAFTHLSLDKNTLDIKIGYPREFLNRLFNYKSGYITIDSSTMNMFESKYSRVIYEMLQVQSTRQVGSVIEISYSIIREYLKINEKQMSDREFDIFLSSVINNDLNSTKYGSNVSFDSKKQLVILKNKACY